jgi:endo-1,4-beta-D-glucanase Y
MGSSTLEFLLAAIAIAAIVSLHFLLRRKALEDLQQIFRSLETLSFREQEIAGRANRSIAPAVLFSALEPCDRPVAKCSSDRASTENAI